MVPAGFNIFPLLRTPVPAGGYEAWRIVMKNGSRATEKVFGIFKVGKGMHGGSQSLSPKYRVEKKSLYVVARMFQAS